MSTFYHGHIPSTPGIYRIRCIVTEKIYVGSAINLYRRRSNHFGFLQRNQHKNPKLQAAWNKYGEDAFTFEVLEIVLVPELLTAREQYWFKKLNPFGKRGFNLAPIAGSHLGLKRSEEVCNNIRAAKIGRPNGNLGKKHSPERIERRRQLSRGKKASEETKRKMAVAHTGRKHSKESREKRSLSLLGHAPANTRTALVISPDGQEYTVCNLAKFSREHGLKRSGLTHVASGRRKQYRGWKASYLD